MVLLLNVSDSKEALNRQLHFKVQYVKLTLLTSELSAVQVLWSFSERLSRCFYEMTFKQTNQLKLSEVAILVGIRRCSEAFSKLNTESAMEIFCNSQLEPKLEYRL